MAGLSRDDLTGWSERPIVRFSDQRHSAMLFIRSCPFTRDEETFNDCLGHCSICCTGFSADKISKEFRKQCNALFGDGRWLDRGCRVEISNNITCLTSSLFSSVRSDFVDFARKFATKVEKGMQKAEQPKQTNHGSSAELGAALLKHQAEVKAQGTETLEKYLNEIAHNTSATAWLATMYSRYFGYQRRRIDSLYSQSGDLYAERKVKEKENICIVATRIMNKLYPYWGVYSSLIFNALKETRFKASYLEDISKKELDQIADLVVTLLLQTEINLTISKDTPIINPAFFLAIFLEQPYSEICKTIGLDRFSDLDLQEEINVLAGSLGQLGLECGQIPVSTLVAKSGMEFECHEENLVIRLGPLQSVQSGQGNSHQGSPHNWSEAGNDWMQFVNLENTELPGREGSNGHLGSA
ncbi:hypothetical protein NPX13_g2251 [Xylaria arbuscula]|uniref:Uncharacterized protein n=1 Tax=Xylaria arbuscula TaxID=114810 RepID=A0A9W8NJI8_9PEZI|nr:hypothetical protein NPX13_g2251 [Xylaria arbuscula]